MHDTKLYRRITDIKMKVSKIGVVGRSRDVIRGKPLFEYRSLKPEMAGDTCPVPFPRKQPVVYFNTAKLGKMAANHSTDLEQLQCRRTHRGYGGVNAQCHQEGRGFQTYRRPCDSLGWSYGPLLTGIGLVLLAWIICQDGFLVARRA